MIVAYQIGDDVLHRTSYIGLDQIDDLRDGGRETSNAQLHIDKERGYPGAGHQIAHIVVGARKIGPLCSATPH